MIDFARRSDLFADKVHSGFASPSLDRTSVGVTTCVCSGRVTMNNPG